jgi:RNA polymerase sigma-70 factor (ECF subfamily)
MHGESMTSQNPAPRGCGERLSKLLARVALQDARAFAELHSLTRNKLRKTAIAVGVSPAEIDDVLQESYLKIWRNAGTFDPDRGSVITWMCTIARYTSIDAGRVRQLATSELKEAISVPNDAGQSESDDFDYARAAMARLPDDRQRLFALAYIDGESRVSLSLRYGVPINTIKTRLRRTLEAVRRDCLAAASEV